MASHKGTSKHIAKPPVKGATKPTKNKSVKMMTKSEKKSGTM